MSHTRTLDPAAPSAACLGAVLRRLRTLHGLTQAELGRLAGYGGSYISAVERAADLTRQMLDMLRGGSMMERRPRMLKTLQLRAEALHVLHLQEIQLSSGTDKLKSHSRSDSVRLQ